MNYNFTLRCIGMVELATQEAEDFYRPMSEITLVIYPNHVAMLIHPPQDNLVLL